MHKLIKKQTCRNLVWGSNLTSLRLGLSYRTVQVILMWNSNKRMNVIWIIIVSIRIRLWPDVPTDRSSSSQPYTSHSWPQASIQNETLGPSSHGFPVSYVVQLKLVLKSKKYTFLPQIRVSLSSTKDVTIKLIRPPPLNTRQGCPHGLTCIKYTFCNTDVFYDILSNCQNSK